MARTVCPKCKARYTPWSEAIRQEIETRAAGKEWLGMIFCKKCGAIIEVDPSKE